MINNNIEIVDFFKQIISNNVLYQKTKYMTEIGNKPILNDDLSNMRFKGNFEYDKLGRIVVSDKITDYDTLNEK